LDAAIQAVNLLKRVWRLVLSSSKLKTSAGHKFVKYGKHIEELQAFHPKKVLDFLQKLIIINPTKKASLGAAIHRIILIARRPAI
jgi:hypothetical protein